MSEEINADSTPLIDLTALEDLRSIMEDEYTEILQLYLEESLSLMTDIHAGFDGEQDNLLRAIENLKSSSNNVAAIRLSAISAKMETLVSAGDIDSARACLDELQQVFTESHSLIKELAQQKSKKVAV